MHAGGVAAGGLPSAATLAALIQDLSALRDELLASETRYGRRLKHIHPSHSADASNLLHYVRLRRHDLRALQDRLTQLGLSSLGRSEPHVMASLEAVLGTLLHLAGNAVMEPPGTSLDFSASRALSLAHENALLGPRPPHRHVRIMVTLPSEAAEDARMVRNLVAAGTDCFRINCAHDDERAWKRMVRNVREAAEAQHRPCRIQMDLAGPKLRTGPMQPGAAVARWRPPRDEVGRVVAPARIWIVPAGSVGQAPPGVSAVLPLQANWLERIEPGSILRVLDARGRSRRLKVQATSNGGWIAESTRTGYIVPGTLVWFEAVGGPDLALEGRVGALPPREETLRLRTGDTLIVTRSLEPGRPAQRHPDGTQTIPARIGCTLPEVFSAARPGQRIFFDDGKLEGVIRSVHQDDLHVELTRTPSRGANLGGDKGINLPDTRLTLGALTAKDRRDLAFAVAHADLVGLSFVGSGRDVLALQTELAKRKGSHLGIVLKIETRRAFEHLPRLLLAAMRNPEVGVMIARGDLAVECGYERLAEAQEEILWMCEAAHLPVIWATQVLESLAKEGRPSRAEITDAAMGVRSECVMLNKGPYIVEAVQMLDDILRRMQDHQEKKRSMLRRLHLAFGLRWL
ncbi:MAG: pyruvate kinase [Candidatus Lambdaproteobacteria bacterium]|nr:pyruvate kinase [Candidatus Lambdaproteobacteria bacterium]